MAPQLDFPTLKRIFLRFRDAEPEPRGELAHVNVYTLVVAVALSAQATDAGVNKATRALFRVADTPQKMLELGEDGLIEHIRTIGLYRQKAKNIRLASRNNFPWKGIIALLKVSGSITISKTSGNGNNYNNIPNYRCILLILC